MVVATLLWSTPAADAASSTTDCGGSPTRLLTGTVAGFDTMAWVSSTDPNHPGSTVVCYRIAEAGDPRALFGGVVVLGLTPSEPSVTPSTDDSLPCTQWVNLQDPTVLTIEAGATTTPISVCLHAPGVSLRITANGPTVGGGLEVWTDEWTVTNEVYCAVFLPGSGQCENYPRRLL